MKLNATNIAKLVPDASKPTFHWDDQTRGFGVKLHPTGEISFVVRYRLKGSRKQRTVVIGRSTMMMLKDAREVALRHLSAARDGRDLTKELIARVQETEAAEVALARRLTVSAAIVAYLAAFEAEDTDKPGRKRAWATVKAERSWLAHLDKGYGPEALEDLTAADIRKTLEPIGIGSRRCVYGAIARLLTWAKREEIVTTNAAENVKRPPRPDARTVRPPLEELRRFIQVVEEMVTEGKLRQAQGDFIVLCVLTAQRRQEVALMQWGDLDLRAMVWNQSADRNKTKTPHVVPLAPRALAILKRRKAEVLAAGGDLKGLVMPAPRSANGMVASADHLMDRVVAKGGFGFLLHDLRRGVVSEMAERGVDFVVADAMIHPKQSASRSGIVGIYQLAELQAPKRRAMEIWERALFGETGDVVPLKRAKA
jgi:integrase